MPVLGAGGIVDGRGVAAAMMLWAAGAWVGTAFFATDEAALETETVLKGTSAFV